MTAASVLPGKIFPTGAAQVLMGVETGSRAMTEALNKGAGNKQAVVYALAATAAESFLSKYNIENLRNLSSESVVRNMGTAIKNIARSAGVSMAESTADSLANTISESLILQNHSDMYQRWYEEYVMADQLQHNDAKARAYANEQISLWLAKKTVGDMLSAALQGGVYGSIANLGGAYNARTIDQYENELAGSNRVDFGKLETKTQLQEARTEKILQKDYSETMDSSKWLYEYLTKQENLDAFDRLMAVYDNEYLKRLKKEGKKREGIEIGEFMLNSISDEGVIRDDSYWKNGELRPNVTYQTGEHEYLFQTNETGRIVRVNAAAIQQKKHDGRMKHNRKTPGKLKQDDAGHLIGDRFGGSPELDNLVSQARKVNRSDYRILENLWAKAIQEANGQRVMAQIDLYYKDNTGRPDRFW